MNKYYLLSFTKRITQSCEKTTTLLHFQENRFYHRLKWSEELSTEICISYCLHRNPVKVNINLENRSIFSE